MAEGVTAEGHSTRGPSGSYTWAACPGSVAAQAPFPETDNEHSLRGTAAHTLVEEVVTGVRDSVPTESVAIPVKTVTGQTIDWILNAEDLVAVNQCVEFARQQMTPDAMFAAEHITDPGPACQGTDMWGTCDLRWYYPMAQYLHLADYKHGRSPVEVENNWQLILYALGEYDALVRAGYPVDKIRMTICQPRRSDGKPALQSVEMTANELLDWIPFFAEARKATDDPNAPRIPGEKQCQWCRASGACPEEAEVMVNGVTQVNQPLASRTAHIPADPSVLPADKLAVIASYLPQFRKWADRVESYMLEQAKAGVKFVDHNGQQWGAVPKKVNRRWKFSEEETMKKLSNKMKTASKSLPKEDRLGIDVYRGHKLLSFTDVIENIRNANIPDEVKEKLVTAVESDLLEKPEPGMKLGPVSVEVIVEEPPVLEAPPMPEPAEETAGYASFLC